MVCVPHRSMYGTRPKAPRQQAKGRRARRVGHICHGQTDKNWRPTIFLAAGGLQTANQICEPDHGFSLLPRVHLFQGVGLCCRYIKIVKFPPPPHHTPLAGILPTTAPVGSARSARRLVAREAIAPIITQSPGRATRGTCRLERRREQELLQLAKCPFGKLARPVLAHPKREQLVAVRAYLAIQAAFQKEDVVVCVAIWSAMHVARQPSAARAQPTTVRIKRSRSRSKDEAGLTLPW